VRAVAREFLQRPVTRLADISFAWQSAVAILSSAA